MVTATLSVEASQAKSTELQVRLLVRGLAGTDGGIVSPPPVSADRLSTFGPPAASVAVARILLEPAARVSVVVTVCQVFHEPVVLNARLVRWFVPLTAMVSGRLPVEPLAYLIVTLNVPALAAPTVHST